MHWLVRSLMLKAFGASGLLDIRSDEANFL